MELIFNLVKGDVSDFELNAGGGGGEDFSILRKSIKERRKTPYC